MKYGLYFLLTVILLPGFADETEPPLADWIHAAEHVLRGETSVSVLTMTVLKPEFERHFDLLLFTDDRAEDDRVLIQMLGPALWRGNMTLKVADRITLFEPRNQRTTVMGSSMLTENWMGSHFTNDDLMRETDLVRHYRYRLLEHWQEHDNQHYLLDLRPEPNAPVAWGKVHYHLLRDHAERIFPVAVHYFRRSEDTEPVRVLSYGELQELGGRLVPTQLTMTLPHKPGEYTRMNYQRIRFDVDLPAERFSERAFR